MSDPVGYAIAFGLMMALGSFLAALLKKSHIEIRSRGILAVFTITLWGIGMGIGYWGYRLLENGTALYFGYFLLTIGGAVGLGSGGLFFNWMAHPAHYPNKPKQPLESSFGYRLGCRLGKWVRDKQPIK